MDPVTHAVIGGVISKAAGEPVSLQNAFSIAAIVGAVFPDADIIFQYWGDYIYLKNHRGATHSLPGLLISALLLGGILSIFYPGASLSKLILWAFAGGLSHTVFDILNSYGAKIFWPLIKRKISLSILIIFDPVLIGFLIGSLLAPPLLSRAFLTGCILYLISRLFMRIVIMLDLEKRFGTAAEKINLLPSMTGIFRWHFIIEDKHFNIVGEKSIFAKGVKIIRKFEKIEEGLFRRAMGTGIGRFFKEFTPIFHVASEKADGIRTMILTDLRYFLNNKFLHHAIIKFDEDYNSAEQSFHPYNIEKKVVL